MAVVTAAEIMDEDNLLAWLEALPGPSQRAVAVSLASRSALRVVPILGRREKMGESDYNDILLLSFNNILLARSSGLHIDVELSEAFGATKAFRVAAYFAEGPIHKAVNAAKSSLFYESSTSVSTASWASKAVYAAIDNPFSDHTGASDIWRQIRDDAGNVELGMGASELLMLQLWQVPPSWWRDEWQAFKTTLAAPEMAAGEWAVWIEWYESITQGHFAFNLKNRQTAETLERRIALGGRDGKFNKEFWTREPSEINREIAEWVAEARLLEAMSDGQGSGFKFKVRDNLVRFFTALGLSAPDSDYKRIKAQLPILLELLDGLSKKVAAASPEDDPLLATLRGLQSLARANHKEVDPNAIFMRSSDLRGRIKQAEKLDRPVDNYYRLQGNDLVTASSIALACDMIVLATPEGEKLFNDADRASVDAGQADLLLAVESEILDLLVDKAAFIDPTVTALLKQLVLSCNDAEHPQRVLYFTNGSLRNLMLVAVGLPMVVSAAVTIGASGIAIAVAALIYDSESELVKLAKTEFGGKVDDFAVKVLLPHEDLVRRWVAQKPASRQVVLDMFERVKANRKS